jgi:hypothetical protein
MSMPTHINPVIHHTTPGGHMTRAEIIPIKTRISTAARSAYASGCGLWLTDRGQVVSAPWGLPGWRRIPIRWQAVA